LVKNAFTERWNFFLIINRKPKGNNTPSNLIDGIFGGYLQSCVQCSLCRFQSCTVEPLLDLSLEITNCDALQRAFSRFTQPEILSNDNKYACSKYFMFILCLYYFCDGIIS